MYAEIVVSNPTETLQDQARTIASELDFPFEILKAVIDSETGGTCDCTLVGKAGEEGCFQIIRKFHPDVDPLNFEASARYFIQEYRKGNEFYWTSCSCIQTIKAFGAEAKGHAADITPNSKVPQKRGVVIFEYKKNPYPYNKHVAFIESMTETGMNIVEGNKTKCAITRRFVPFNDTSINGYRLPSSGG